MMENVENMEDLMEDEDMVIVRGKGARGGPKGRLKFGDVGVLLVLNIQDRDMLLGEVVVFSDESVTMKKAGGVSASFTSLAEAVRGISYSFPAYEVVIGGPGFDVVQLDGDGEVLKVHPGDECHSDSACSIHNVSDHPLQDALQVWDGDSGVLFRVCEHKVRHPDADLPNEIGDSVWAHQCCVDGCCGIVGDGVLIPTMGEPKQAPVPDTGPVAFTFTCPICNSQYRTVGEVTAAGVADDIVNHFIERHLSAEDVPDGR